MEANLGGKAKHCRSKILFTAPVNSLKLIAFFDMCTKIRIKVNLENLNCDQTQNLKVQRKKSGTKFLSYKHPIKIMTKLKNSNIDKT